MYGLTGFNNQTLRGIYYIQVERGIIFIELKKLGLANWQAQAIGQDGSLIAKNGFSNFNNALLRLIPPA